MSAYSFMNSVTVSSGGSGGIFKRLIFKSLGRLGLVMFGEKDIVKSFISKVSQQKVSTICFVVNSIETKF